MKTKHYLLNSIIVLMSLLFFTACEKKDEDADVANFKVHLGNGTTDIDGNEYVSVIIGNQEWMAENLKTTKYNDGTAIPLVTNNWGRLSTPAYCWYDNNEATNGNTYGAFYNWYTVSTEKLCPPGWHVPTDAEWTILTDYLGGENVAGAKLKSTVGWKNNIAWVENGNGTNEVGFSALPGGFRYDNGPFDYVGYFGKWWSSSQDGEWNAWSKTLNYGDENVSRSSSNNKSGFSVRCLKD